MYLQIERAQPADVGEHAFVYLDGVWLKRSWGGEVRNVSVLIRWSCGRRQILDMCEGAKADKASWLGFLRHLKARGLKGVRLVISDKCLGLVESLGEVLPDAQWQRCDGALVIAMRSASCRIRR